jgi:hypothetical protein
MNGGVVERESERAHIQSSKPTVKTTMVLLIRDKNMTSIYKSCTTTKQLQYNYKTTTKQLKYNYGMVYRK